MSILSTLADLLGISVEVNVTDEDRALRDEIRDLNSRCVSRGYGPTTEELEEITGEDLEEIW